MLITDGEASAIFQNLQAARDALRAAGVCVADDIDPLGMVSRLIRLNQDQRKLEDGLRERMKAAEQRRMWLRGALDFALAEMSTDDAQANALQLLRNIREIIEMPSEGRVYEVDTEGGTCCPFHITVGGCNARRSKENGDWCRCAEEPRSVAFPDDYPERPPCRLDEGPILVKKAEDDTPSKSAHTLAVEEVDNASRAYTRHHLGEWCDRQDAGSDSKTEG